MAVLLVLAAACTTPGDPPDSERVGSSETRLDVVAELTTSHPAQPYGGTAASTTGQAWGDSDGDGLVDLYVTDQSGPNVLYHRSTRDRFEVDAWAEDVSLPEVASTRATWQELDADADTLPELSVLTENGIHIFRNDGPEGGFVDVTADTGLPTGMPATSLAWGDLDLDGHLDLFLGHMDGGWGLWHNEGDLRFTAITGENPRGSPVVSAAIWNLGNDPYPEVFLVRPTGTQLLAGRTLRPLPSPTLEGGRSVSLGDIVGDGQPEVVVVTARATPEAQEPGASGELHLLAWEGAGLDEVSPEAPPPWLQAGAGDVAVLSPGRRAYLTGSGADVLFTDRGAAELDLHAPGEGAAAGPGGLVARGSDAGPYFVVRTRDAEGVTTLHFDATTVGATVRVTGDSQPVYLVGVGPGTGAGHAPLVEIPRSAASEVEITWPDGTRQLVNVKGTHTAWRIRRDTAPVPAGPTSGDGPRR